MILLLACAKPETPPVACGDVADTQAGVVTELRFARDSDDGVSSEGFDLDGAAGDVCDIPDYVDAAGNPGIDNAFARLVPALEATEAAAVEGLIQDAINTGGLLIMYELARFDDPVDDPCVDLSLLRGEGDVSLGTDGTLEWSQTFDRDPDTPASTVTGLPLSDGRVVARPIDYDLPIQILNANVLFHLHEGALRVDVAEDGSSSGLLAGGVAVADVIAVAQTENVDADLAAMVESLVQVTADLDKDGDGVCEQISMTFTFEAVPAFFFGD